ncbi:hypothetical protein L873DRAFT_1680592, partial [Choiromyces venosus 120613-1]
DEIWHKVIIHGIPTTIFSTPERFNNVKTEIEEFNPGLHHRNPMERESSISNGNLSGWERCYRNGPEK